MGLFTVGNRSPKYPSSGLSVTPKHLCLSSSTHPHWFFNQGISAYNENIATVYGSALKSLIGPQRCILQCIAYILQCFKRALGDKPTQVMAPPRIRHEVSGSVPDTAEGHLEWSLRTLSSTSHFKVVKKYSVYRVQRPSSQIKTLYSSSSFQQTNQYAAFIRNFWWQCTI